MGFNLSHHEPLSRRDGEGGKVLERGQPHKGGDPQRAISAIISERWRRGQGAGGVNLIKGYLFELYQGEMEEGERCWMGSTL